MTKPPCDFPGCEQERVSGCDCCETNANFCEDHGTKRVLYCGIDTAVCWKCGGYNADAE